MLELITTYERYGLDKKKLKQIAGVAFHDGREVRITGRRELIRPLDRIPFPARNLLKITEGTHVITSRGCPYRCAFCSSSNFWQTTRFFSAAYVVSEIKYLVQEYGITNINIYDDLFIADRARIKEIAKLIEQEEFLKDISFSCLARANLIDSEVCGLLKDMGVKSISFGFESGSNKILSYLKKGTVTVEANRQALDICKSHGLVVSASFIIGSPEETREDIQATLDFIKRNDLSEFDIYVLTPLPGTEVWEYARGKGMVGDRMDWSILNVESFNPKESLILTDRLGREEFYELYLEFCRERDKRKRLHIRRYAEELRTEEIFSYSNIRKALANPRKAGLVLKDVLLSRTFRRRARNR